ncbi:MAG: helix-turn-helix domain-containing protein [Pseudomonadota bacterium]
MSEVRTYSTGDVRKRHRLAYWNDTLSQSFTRKFVEPREADSFEGRFEIVRAGECNIANVVQGASDVIHTWQHARRDDPAVTFHLQVFGETINEQDQRVIRLGPGEFCICSSERPYDVRMDRNMGLFVIKIPRERFLAVCPELDKYVCRRVSGQNGTGKILTAFLQSFWRELLLGMPNEQAGAMADVGIGLIGQAIQDPNEGSDRRGGGTSRIYEIQEYIERHLADAALTPAEIARTFAMSTRNLHRIFADNTSSVGAYIKQRRLERAREILGDKQFANLRIADTALMVGFTNLAHFSTAFKQAYGASPYNFRSYMLKR